jgi:hypothetical protein
MRVNENKNLSIHSYPALLYLNERHVFSIKVLYNFFIAGLAQLVERLICNQ